MLFERIRYQNHLGEILDFGKCGLFVEENDLRNFAWEVQTNGDRITGFRRGIAQKTLPVSVAFRNPAYVKELKKRLFEFCEKDVIAKKYGKIIVGEYYFECYVTSSAKSHYTHDKDFTHFELGVATDRPFWISERTTPFRKGTSSDESGENLDYPYDYPYDYYAAGNAQRIVNSFFAPVDFRMVIYGAVNNPTITIGGHTYRVNVTVQSGEYLTIDSMAKTIVLTQNNGTKVNKFDNRDRTSYIFEPIPSGYSAVAWDSNFDFDITLIETRSEPQWI